MRRAVPVVLVLALGAGAAEAAVRTDGSTPAPKQIARAVTHVSTTTLNTVGAGDASSSNAQKLSGTAYESGGKPAVLTGDLAWCPHCAANNWALAVALSRFGHLTGIRIINTGTLYCTKYHAKPCFPHTEGLSLFHAHLKSSFISFTAVVLQDVKGHNLQKPTGREEAAIKSFDSQGSFPAVDVGGVYGFIGPAYSPGVLAHKTWSEVARMLASGKGRVALSIDGSANIFAAAICKATGGKPSDVCDSKGVVTAAATLPQTPPP